LPGILKRVSLSFYTWSMIFDAGASRGIAPFPNMIFRPVTGETAGIVLLSLTAALIALGAVLFARREYGEAN